MRLRGGWRGCREVVAGSWISLRSRSVRSGLPCLWRRIQPSTGSARGHGAGAPGGSFAREFPPRWEQDRALQESGSSGARASRMLVVFKLTLELNSASSLFLKGALLSSCFPEFFPAGQGGKGLEAGGKDQGVMGGVGGTGGTLLCKHTPSLARGYGSVPLSPKGSSGCGARSRARWHQPGLLLVSLPLGLAFGLCR